VTAQFGTNPSEKRKDARYGPAFLYDKAGNGAGLNAELLPEGERKQVSTSSSTQDPE